MGVEIADEYAHHGEATHISQRRQEEQAVNQPGGSAAAAARALLGSSSQASTPHAIADGGADDGALLAVSRRVSL